jgi:hypothetical protein
MAEYSHCIVLITITIIWAMVVLAEQVVVLMEVQVLMGMMGQRKTVQTIKLPF